MEVYVSEVVKRETVYNGAVPLVRTTKGEDYGGWGREGERGAPIVHGRIETF